MPYLYIAGGGSKNHARAPAHSSGSNAVKSCSLRREKGSLLSHVSSLVLRGRTDSPLSTSTFSAPSDGPIIGRSILGHPWAPPSCGILSVAFVWLCTVGIAEMHCNAKEERKKNDAISRLRYFWRGERARGLQQRCALPWRDSEAAARGPPSDSPGVLPAACPAGRPAVDMIRHAGLTCLFIPGALMMVRPLLRLPGR